MQVATYKGRKYKLAWSGKTKFGEKAKLQFFDGSKEFWVDLSLVEISASKPREESFDSRRKTYRRKYGWDGVVGSASYYSSGLYDEES